MIIDDLTANVSSKINSEVYRAPRSDQIEASAAQLKGNLFAVQMDNDTKHTTKATWPQPSRACSSLTEDKTEGRETQKEAANEYDCSKGLTKQLEKKATYDPRAHTVGSRL